jgi:hypothetical protein
MGLPPGRDPKRVEGINSDETPRLAQKAGELAAWVDYLLDPWSNDGPRVYRPTSRNADRNEFESPYRLPPPDRDVPYEDPDEYQTVSVIEQWAPDPGVFFRPVQAVCSVTSEAMSDTFNRLRKGCLTFYDEEVGKMPYDEEVDAGKIQTHKPAPELQYNEENPSRIDWVGMRKSWLANEDVVAHEYEFDFLNYQTFTENAIFTIAEHLVRYRAIMHQAGEDMLALMEKMVDLCPRPGPEPAPPLNLKSIIVTGLVAAATTVVTGGVGTTFGVVLGTAAIEMLGEAAKTAEPAELVLDDKQFLRDVAKQYIEGIEKIEREVAEAVEKLGTNLNERLTVLRDQREYQTIPDYGRTTREVPKFPEFLQEFVAHEKKK